MTERQEGDVGTPDNTDSAIRPDAANLDLIDRFLTDRLDSKERAIVESRIVVDPEFRREVELTEAFRAGMRELAKRGDIAPLLAPPATFWSHPPFAVAATIVAVVLAVISLLLYERLGQTRQDLITLTHLRTRSDLIPPIDSEILRFEHTRGATGGPDVTWRRSRTPTLLTMFFDVGLEPKTAYTVTITRLATDADATVLTVPHIGVDADGLAAIAINSELLDAGDYRVKLESGSIADGLIVYGFHVFDDSHAEGIRGTTN